MVFDMAIRQLTIEEIGMGSESQIRTPTVSDSPCPPKRRTQTYQNYHKEYRQRPYIKARRKEYQKKYKKDYRQRPVVKARRRARRQLPEVKMQDLVNGKVLNAIKSGKLKREPCEHCGTNEDVQGHHPDYNKPLEVIWLCPCCHGQEHIRIREEANITDTSSFDKREMAS